MDNMPSLKKADLSVADRVLSTFIAAVAEDEKLAEIAPRLTLVLLDGDSINETALRHAIFGDTGS